MGGGTGFFQAPRAAREAWIFLISRGRAPSGDDGAPALPGQAPRPTGHETPVPPSPQ